MPAPIIVKASGEQQRFSPKKLRASLLKCGLDQKCARETTEEVARQVRDQMSSRGIFNLAHQKLKQTNRPIAYRYSLKRAIFELGPTGFPFEQIIGRLFEKLHYDVKTNLMVPGKCIEHEVDCILERPGETAWVECKFHNVPGTISDLKTALYVYARYLDLKEYRVDSRDKAMWLVSNTRFSSEAIQFSNCRGVNLLGWEYPVQGGLNVLLERNQLYPITTLSTLSRKQKLHLMDNQIYTTEDFQENRKKVLRSGLTEQKWADLCFEIDSLHKLEIEKP